ncbi:hypothetical protein IFR05_000519 [Cadophora sp. M221]|nr:hypothetical protein IFR05_000519 [Cadophora sp. M221]
MGSGGPEFTLGQELGLDNISVLVLVCRVEVSDNMPVDSLEYNHGDARGRSPSVLTRWRSWERGDDATARAARGRCSDYGRGGEGSGGEFEWERGDDAAARALRGWRRFRRRETQGGDDEKVLQDEGIDEEGDGTVAVIDKAVEGT